MRPGVTVETMGDDFHKPVNFSGSVFENMCGGVDPAQIAGVARETAQVIVKGARFHSDPGVVERIIAYVDENGIDAFAELWSHAHAQSLPGALWRVYLLRMLIRNAPDQVSFFYQRGVDVVVTIDPVVAGAEAPTGPAEIVELADHIVRGVFTGDFGVALERAAAFCRVTALGCTSVADDLELAAPDRASELTSRALRFSTIAAELTSCVRLWKANSLD